MINDRQDARIGELATTRGYAEDQPRPTGIAHRIQGEITDRAKSIADGQKIRAARGLDVAVRAFRRTSEDLHKEEWETAADYLDQVADQVGKVSDYLRTRAVDALMDDIENSIRRRPGVAIATGMLVGLFLARFLKSSSARGRRPWEGIGRSSTG